MSRLNLFAIFHLNLAFSSIEEEQYPQVIEKCYWPLLRLMEKYRLPFGIEVTAYTLNIIQRLDPQWVQTLRRLLEKGIGEFIGSGHAQLIGPLVPAEVNAANLRLGNAAYEQLLGRRPEIALVNEQAYAPGLIPLYKQAGYKAIVMEWDNPAGSHPEWPRTWSYLPQKVQDAEGNTMPVIWNHSIAFQKFQRYVHGELNLQEYLDYLQSHWSSQPRWLSLYGNDVEVFDFRPGRFHTEANLQAGEWLRIDELFACLRKDDRFQLVATSDVLPSLKRAGAGNVLTLESAQQPVPVKKQAKYNISRWACTGRDDVRFNTLCHRIHQHLLRTQSNDDNQWRQLCELWASDLRTHITEKRWHKAGARMSSALSALGLSADLARAADVEACATSSMPQVPGMEITQQHHDLHIRTDKLSITLNTYRGLTLKSLAFRAHKFKPVAGTLAHGYFDNIALGADYYTGVTTIELPMEHKRITDLVQVTPRYCLESDWLRIEAVIPTAKGDMIKCVRIHRQEQRVQLSIDFPGWQRPHGVVRVGCVTLLPEAFKPPILLAAINGGRQWQGHRLVSEVNQPAPASTLVSCNAGWGATSGRILIGDQSRQLLLAWNPAECAAFPLVVHKPSTPGALTRIMFSLAELDESSKPGGTLPGFALTLSPFSGHGM